MLKITAIALILGFAVNAVAEGQAVLDGMLMIKDGSPSVMQIEGPSARAFYKGLTSAPVSKAGDEEDCALQWVKTGEHLTCAYCGTSSNDHDSASKYWCTMNIDLGSGHVHAN